MTGIEVYNNDFEKSAKKRIADNNDKPYLEDFYYFMLSDTSYSASYNYLGCVINFLNNVQLDDISKIKLGNYTKYMSTLKQKSSSYRIDVYSALKKFSSFLKADGVCNEDYMQSVKRPKFKERQTTRDKREKGYMTKDEIVTFINNVKSSNKENKWKIRDLAIITIFLNTGIRCSALYKLDINNINMKSRSITVLEKGDLSRSVYVSEQTLNYIKDWLSVRKEIVGDNETALFVSDRKRRMTTRTIYNIVKSYGVVIKEKNITPHKMRGTFITNLYEDTGDLYLAQECAGHADPKTTGLYIRGQKEKASKKAADIIGKMII